MVQTCTTLCGGDEKTLKRSGITWPQWGLTMWSTIQKSMCLMSSKSRPGMSLEQDQSLTWSLDTLEKTVSKSWLRSSFSFMRATHVEAEEKWKPNWQFVLKILLTVHTYCVHLDVFRAHWCSHWPAGIKGWQHQSYHPLEPCGPELCPGRVQGV